VGIFFPKHYPKNLFIYMQINFFDKKLKKMFVEGWGSRSVVEYLLACARHWAEFLPPQKKMPVGWSRE
jgi:hypothetical protein